MQALQYFFNAFKNSLQYGNQSKTFLNFKDFDIFVKQSFKSLVEKRSSLLFQQNAVNAITYFLTTSLIHDLLSYYYWRFSSRGKFLDYKEKKVEKRFECFRV